MAQQSTLVLILLLLGTLHSLSHAASTPAPTLDIGSPNLSLLERFWYWSAEALKETPPSYRNQAEQWANRTGPAYALKLLSAVGYSPKWTNLTFSPLALKLQLLALGSLDAEYNVEVSRFLFGLPDDAAIDFTSLATPRHSPDGPDTPPVVGFTARPLHHRTWGQSLTYWWNLVVSTFYHLGYRTQPSAVVQVGGGPSPPTSAYIVNSVLSTNLKLTQLYEVCSAFDYRPLHTISECAKYLSIPHYYTPPSSLTPYEKVRLCLEFGILYFDECVRLFGNDSEASYSRPVWSNGALAVHLLGAFHSANASKLPGTLLANVNGLHRVWITDGNTTLGTAQRDQMERTFQMPVWDLRKEPLKWAQFKSSFPKWTRSLPSTLPTPSLYSLVDFQQEYAQRFSYIGKRSFYGPKKWGHIRVKVDTLFSRGVYGRVHHLSGPYTHTLLRLPYLDARFSLVLLLPHLNSTIPDLIASLRPNQLSHYLKRLHIEQTTLSLTLPRFTISGDYDFAPLLKENYLDRVAVNGSTTTTAPFASVLQSVRIGGQQLEPQEEQPHDESAYEAMSSDTHLLFNRPFVYLVVGKYIDLYSKPAFDVLVAGYYNGPY